MEGKTPEAHEALLELVDFKWLMACVGWRVNLERLQCDPAYLESCLERSLSSGCELLLQRGAAMLQSLRR